MPGDRRRTRGEGRTDRRIPVLLLIDRLLAAGGAEALVSTVAQHLPRERFEVSVCATRVARGPLVEQLEDAGIEVFSLGRSGRLDLLPLVRLARYLRRRRVAVIHSHMFGSNFWGAVVGRAAGVDVIVAHEHTWSFTGQPVRLRIERHLIGPSVDALVAGTSAVRDQMISVTGLPAQKVVVIPGPYVQRPVVPGDLRGELGLGPETPVVGTIAVLRPEKALEVLLDAFREVLHTLPEARLIMVGDGPQRSALEAAAAQLEIAHAVHFLGIRRDVATILAGLDVAVISSDYEGTSLFMVECITHGVPLVSTRVGGPAEYLEDGISARLVPTRDSEALARALLSVLEHPERGRALAAAAGAVASEFDPDRIAARHAALYERLLAGGPPIPPESPPAHG